MIFDPQHATTREIYNILIGSVIPRPIALASTIDAQGRVNLSPFSYFNIFGSNPPLMVFSPTRKSMDQSNKDSYDNVKEVPEVCINLVAYSIVEQVSLASAAYAKGVNEFEKSGLTPAASDKIAPPRVAESPVAFECKVLDVLEYGGKGGSANLIVCEAVLIHVDDKVLTSNLTIDPVQLDLVARLGGDYYCRVNEQNIFKIPKPVSALGIGVDQVPESIKRLPWLTGNELGRLATISSIPEKSSLEESTVHSIRKSGIEATVIKLLEENNVEEAWRILLH